MFQTCKFCGSQMQGEYETLSSSNHYRFFFTCPNCHAIYEGERKERGDLVLLNDSRWYNPNSHDFEK